MEKSKLEKAIDFILGNEEQEQEEVIEKEQEETNEVEEKEVVEVEEDNAEEVEVINEFNPEIHDVVVENGVPRIIKKEQKEEKQVQEDLSVIKDAEIQAYKVAIKKGVTDEKTIKDLTDLFVKIAKGEIGDLENIVDLIAVEEKEKEGQVISKKKKTVQRRVRIN